MSLQRKQFYKFADFRLDLSEKVLLLDDKPVPLTPKVFDTLKVLVENAGQLVAKDELMQKIWRDRFVEENNLTFNIKMLRKALGDCATKPQFIETVPRRGYRFIAGVSENFVEIDPPNSSSEIDVLIARANFNGHKSKSFFIPLASVAVLLALIVTLGAWFIRSKNKEANAPVLSTPFASEKLSTNGKVFNAVLSPDGKSVIYTNGAESEKQSVRLRQLDDGGSVEIIPPSDATYHGLKISPDGKLLYFVRRSRETDEPPGIYRVSIFGGIPQKIISEAHGALSLSPDGTRISFVRCPRRDNEFYSLWIADSADGKNERKIAARPRPSRIADNQIAPDGRSIVFAVGQSENAGNGFGLMEIDLETGAEREFTSEKFFNIKGLAWLPDQSGLLITASRVPNKNFRIWQVSARSGEAVPLTNDSETYATLSLDNDAAKIVSTRITDDFRLQIFSAENSVQKRSLANAMTTAFAPSGKIFFSSAMSGNEEIWSINSDGSSQQQLTNTTADESRPVASPDGNTVFFVSNRTGAAQVWRMNTDGSNQTQITHQEGGFPFFVSPDGEWVYYHHGINRTLWRVSVKTGEEQMVLNKAKYRFAISPDAAQVAYSEKQDNERILTVASLADGKIVKSFHLADRKNLLLDIVWTPDGKNLAYISANREYENNVLWLHPLDNDAPRQLAVLGDEEMSEVTSLAVSPDGKSFAVIQGRWLHDAVLLKGLR